MPGTATCGRCASPLGGSVAVGVHPPRAGRWTKRMRAFTLPRRAMYAARDAVGERDRPFIPFTDHLPPWPVLGRTVIPGWAQHRAGQQWQAHLMLWSYLACLLPGLLTFGTSFGSMMIGSAFSVHAWSMADVLNQAFADRSFRAQLGRSLAACLMLGIVVYWPAGYLLTWVASPMTLNYSAGPFANGDVLLTCPLATMRPGRAVVYTLENDAYAGRAEGHTYYTYTGDCIDRVLAKEGDVVTCKDGQLTVNGVDAAWRPLVPEFRVPDFTKTVPHGSVLIVPSTVAGMLARSETPVTARFLVRRESVQVVVYARSSPLRKWMWLN